MLMIIIITVAIVSNCMRTLVILVKVTLSLPMTVWISIFEMSEKTNTKVNNLGGKIK